MKRIVDNSLPNTNVFHRENLSTLVAMILVIFLGSCKCNSPLTGDSCSESDFATREDQITFLNHYSPVPIPPSARDIHFEWVSHMEWTLICSFGAHREDIEHILTQIKNKPYRPDRRCISNELLSGYEYYDKGTRRGAFVSVNVETNRVQIESYGK